MRVLRTLCGLVAAIAGIAVGVFGADTPVALQEEITNGLRWYFHWQKPLPQGKRVNCQAQAFTDSYFVYCDQGTAFLNLARGAGSVNVVSIASTNDDFATALRLFASASHQAASSARGLLFPLDSDRLAAYESDDGISGLRMRETEGYMRSAMRVYADRGREVRCLFPLVSKTDPFYEVYLVEADRVESVWLFPVLGEKLQDHPSWVYDVAHHNIPETAESHLSEAARWYGSIPSRPGR